MLTLVAVIVIAVGAVASVCDRRFGESSVETSRTMFGLELQGRSRTLMVAWSRAIAIICGAAPIVGGVAGLVN